MMEKQQANRVLAFLICSVLFLMYLQNTWNPYFYGDRARPVPTAGQSSSAPATIATPQGSTGQVAAQPQAAQQLPPPASDLDQIYPQDEELKIKGSINLSTPLADVSIALKGGRLSKYMLRGFKEEAKENSPELNLVEHASGQPLPLGIYFSGTNDSEVEYRLTSSSGQSVQGSDYILQNGQITFVLEGALHESFIRKTIVFSADSYLLDCKIEVQNKGTSVPFELEWTRRVTEKSPSLLDQYVQGEFVWFDGEKTHREVFSAFEKKTKKEQETKQSQGINETRFEEGIDKTHWVTSGDVYFMATIVAREGFTTGRLIKTPDLYRTRLSASAEKGNFYVYIGPKKIDILKALPFDLKRNINIGITAPIVEPMMYLLRFLYVLLGNYGLAIIGFSLIAKFVLLPLTLSTFKQTKAMQALQPEMARIKEHVKDKQQQQVQMMELYKKNGVNPLGGCLPAFIQLPIFIGLYSALQLSFELRHAPFALWIKDLSAKEALMVYGYGVPVMVILFIISSVLQIWLMPSSDDPQQKMQRRMMIILLPIMFGFMFANLPAGLTLYFLVSNIIGIVQQTSYNHSGSKSATKVTLIVSAVVMILGFVVTKI